MFNSILQEAGLKLSDVRLVRHKDKRAQKGRTPYELWCKQRSKFEKYQSLQRISNRKKFSAPYWAAFVVNNQNETTFAGLYSVDYIGLLKQDTPMIQRDGIDKAGSCDEYNLELMETLNEYIGKLIIEWGPAPLAWVQYPEQNNKQIIAL